jgi:hypothetical protein
VELIHRRQVIDRQVVDVLACLCQRRQQSPEQPPAAVMAGNVGWNLAHLLVSLVIPPPNTHIAPHRRFSFSGLPRAFVRQCRLDAPLLEE